MSDAARRTGSWPLLAALCATFLGLFFWQRQRSSFLAIEGDLAAARAIAREHGLTLPEVMALRELIGVEVAAEAWSVAADRFQAERQQLGDPLAVVALAGEPDAAAAARRAAGDAATAWLEFQVDPRAAPGLRYLAMRDRFATRGRASD